MDETMKPLRIPPHMSYYADKHNVFDMMQSILTRLVIDQPEDPISYMISLLQRRSMDIPKIMLLGPPGVGKHTVAQKLSAALGTVHESLEGLLQDPSELSAQARQYKLREQEVPGELVVTLIQQRLNKPDCFNRGWLLEGLPQNRIQALSLQQAGIIPDHVVILEAPDDVLLERSQGKLVDSMTGDVYHKPLIWPDEDMVAQRLEKAEGPSEKQRLAELNSFRCEVRGLSSAYQHVLKIINSNQPHADVYQQVLAFVKTRCCARTPRILLLGPPGSGKSLQARLLSEKYKMVDVCCGQLLRAVAADSSALSKKIQPYVDHGRRVPDYLVLEVLEERLGRLDCSCRGWILHDFPSDLQQAKSLQETIHQPNRVFLLELMDDSCLERITLRTTDPFSGERYHAVTKPAPRFEVQKRLKNRPEDSADTVTQKLRHYRMNVLALQSVYPDALKIDANQDPHSVFEALESRLKTK